MVEVNQPAQTESKPVPTNIRELYAEFEKDASINASKGAKASKIRDLVKDIAKQVGKTRVSQAAVYKVIRARFPDEKIDRSYFNNIIEKSWDTERDDQGAVWILTDKSKIKEVPTSS